MKKILILAAALVLVACGSDNSADQKGGKPAKTATAPKADGTQGAIAYVELDSVNSKYQFVIDQNAALEQEQKGYQNTLQQKASAIEQGAAQLQQKMQSGQIKSEAEYNKAAQSLQSQQQSLQNLEQQYGEAISKRTADLQSALQDSINNYIKVFNADGKYSLILGKQSVSILYAAPGYDITDEFIEGLNKRYKK